MSNSNASATEVKQLRDEVQLLRDELAIMKRKYEDIIYNLDTDNFSGRFVKEQGDMRAAIEFNAKGIKTKVSNEEFSSQMEQTAEAIKTKVSQQEAETLKESILTQTSESINTAVTEVNEKFGNYSTTEQTAELIRVAVEGANPDMTGYATTEWTQDAIVNTVNKTFITNLVNSEYETKTNASGNYNELESSIEQNADSIEMVVAKNLSATFTMSKIPTKSNNSNVQKGMLCERIYTDGSSTLYYYNGKTEEWEEYPYPKRVSSQFLQTADGFELVGDVKVRGDLIGADYDGDKNNGRTVMNSDGLDVYDADDNLKLAMGTYKSRYRKSSTSPWVGDSILYPYLALGAGTKKYDGDDVKENIADDAGCVCKLQNGIWIGDTSFIAANRGGKYPGGVSAKVDVIDNYGASVYCGVDCNGIFIDFTDGKVYNYQDGFPYLISV